MKGYENGGSRNSALFDAICGAVAGGVAVWVMDQVDWYLYRHEDAEAKRETAHVRPAGLDPAHVMADRASAAFGHELTPRQPHPAGIAVHYSLGIAPGAIYGVLHDRLPMARSGRGALYGVGLFLIQDELVNAATGLSGRPDRYPWQAHARGLVAHVVLGVVTDTLVRAFKGSRAL